jgi:hypothetical protein
VGVPSICVHERRWGHADQHGTAITELVVRQLRTVTGLPTIWIMYMCDTQDSRNILLYGEQYPGSSPRVILL